MQSPYSRPQSSGIRELWAWNFQDEFRALAEAAAGDGAIVALDTEFPGVLREGPWWSSARHSQYEALRCNVDLLRPIQLGIAVACAFPAAGNGEGDEASGRAANQADIIHKGVWTFNLRFDVLEDLHTEDSIAFLARAGVDFPRHAAEGVDAALLGRFLATSPLAGAGAPMWLTFSGLYDLGYLLKVLGGSAKPLPRDLAGFEDALDAYCPRRLDLREWLPHGSLDKLARGHGLLRRGAAHTAGSDALLTLRLFAAAVPQEDRAVALGKSVSPAAATAAAAAKAAAFAAAATSAPLGPPPGLSLPPGEERPKAATASSWAASARWAMIGATPALEAAAAGAPPRRAAPAPAAVWGAAAREAAMEARAAAALSPAWCGLRQGRRAVAPGFRATVATA